MFTFTALFATTCLLLTKLNAEYDWDSGDGPAGYGAATAWSEWNSPIAETWHNYYVYNTIGKPIKYYWEFEAILERNDRELLSPGDFGDGWVNLRDDWTEGTDRYSFDLTRRRGGPYEVIAKTDLESKVDTNNDGHLDTFDSWGAEDTTSFNWNRFEN